jgi:hypothetical protein
MHAHARTHTYINSRPSPKMPHMCPSTSVRESHNISCNISTGFLCSVHMHQLRISTAPAYFFVCLSYVCTYNNLSYVCTYNNLLYACTHNKNRQLYHTSLTSKMHDSYACMCMCVCMNVYISIPSQGPLISSSSCMYLYLYVFLCIVSPPGRLRSSHPFSRSCARRCISV